MNHWLIIATIIAIIPIFLLKQYILTNNYLYIVLSLCTYSILIISYINLFRNNQVSSIYVLLQILQIFLVVSVSLLFYNEHIKLSQLVGIILGSVAIYLLT
jgi:multidrug transporter EmrE-like cation transporter